MCMCLARRKSGTKRLAILRVYPNFAWRGSSININNTTITINTTTAIHININIKIALVSRISSTISFMNLRSAIAPPPNPPSCAHSRYISFLHPAYDEPSNTLLRLYAPDLPGHRGLDVQYALVACGIIAGNRWDGWLTLDRSSSSSEEARVQPNDGILREANYYFHLPHPVAPSAAHDREDNSDTTSSPTPYQYPVVPTFQEWSFPTQLPQSWIHLLPPPPPTQTYSQSALSVAIKNRDTFCRISGCRDAVQAAHLCPLSEEQWFRKNNMGRYSNESSARNGINSPANAYLLRADLHYLHDCLYFVFVPKIGLDGTPQMVFHLTEPLDEIESLYHNRRVHRLQVSPEYLFARFARTIFPSIQDFLLAQVPRRIKIGHGTPRMMTPTELEKFSVKSTRSRSHSPKKRKISTDSIPPCTEMHGHQRKRKRMRASPDTKTSDPDVHEAVSPELPPTTSFNNKVTVSPGTSDPATPGSVASLKVQWLAKERDRSGVDGALEAEQEWLEDVYAGKIMVGDESARWFEAQGIEIQSDDDCNSEEWIPKESDVT